MHDAVSATGAPWCAVDPHGREGGRRLRVVIVNPGFLEPPVFPVGLEYNAEVLAREGHDVRIVDLNQAEPVYPDRHFPELTAVVVRNLDIGPGNARSALTETRQLVDELHDRYPCPIVVAGSAVNVMPEAIRRHLGADYAIAGKGHNALRSLVRHIQNGVPTPTRVFEDYTDSVSGVYERPFVDKTPYTKHPIGVATHFGCPFRCQYCNYPAVEGYRVTTRPARDVVGELLNLRRQGVRRVFFCDSVFNVPVDHATALLRLMEAEGVDLEWDGFFNPHPNAFTEDFADAATATGRKRIHFGVDSLSDTVLKKIHKGYSVKDVHAAVDRCTARGLPVSISLLFGHPDETRETVLETFRNLDTFDFDAVDVTEQVRIYPRTTVAEIARRVGAISGSDEDLLLPTFYPIVPGMLDTVRSEASRRATCVGAGLDQYIYNT